MSTHFHSTWYTRTIIKFQPIFMCVAPCSFSDLTQGCLQVGRLWNNDPKSNTSCWVLTYVSFIFLLLILFSASMSADLDAKVVSEGSAQLQILPKWWASPLPHRGQVGWAQEEVCRTLWATGQGVISMHFTYSQGILCTLKPATGSANGYRISKQTLCATDRHLDWMLHPSPHYSSILHHFCDSCM